jgi:hypothetical protein
MKPNKHIILDILYTIPDIFPVRLSRPVKDEHGLVYDKVQPSALDGEIILESVPVNGGNVEMGISHFTVHRLLGILYDLVKAWRAKHDKRVWDFVQDEERYTLDDMLFWAGVLTDGERFLYWKTDPTNYSYERTYCHIYNSVLMTDDSEEVCYPWTDENDELVTECLNSMKNPHDWCGDDSALHQIDFLDWEECEIWDSIRHEDLRHEISHILTDTDEDRQIECNIPILDGKATVVSAYQIPGDGTIWFRVEGDFPTKDEDGYANLDDICTADLETIFEVLEHQD